jgi:hypothetical protein
LLGFGSQASAPTVVCVSETVLQFLLDSASDLHLLFALPYLFTFVEIFLVFVVGGFVFLPFCDFAYFLIDIDLWFVGICLSFLGGFCSLMALGWCFETALFDHVGDH